MSTVKMSPALTLLVAGAMAKITTAPAVGLTDGVGVVVGVSVGVAVAVGVAVNVTGIQSPKFCTSVVLAEIGTTQLFGVVDE